MEWTGGEKDREKWEREREKRRQEGKKRKKRKYRVGNAAQNHKHA